MLLLADMNTPLYCIGTKLVVQQIAQQSHKLFVNYVPDIFSFI